jgi:hypothetical protein
VIQAFIRPCKARSVGNAVHANGDFLSEIYNVRMDVYSFIIVTSATFIRDVDLEFHVPKVKIEVLHNSQFISCSFVAYLNN